MSCKQDTCAHAADAKRDKCSVIDHITISLAWSHHGDIATSKFGVHVIHIKNQIPSHARPDVTVRLTGRDGSFKLKN